MKYTIYWLIFRLTVKLLVFFTDSIQLNDIWKDDGTILKGGKSSVARDEDTNTMVIVLFDPLAHISVIDVLNSAFHECRHLQQVKKYGRGICDKWSEFAKRSRINYQLSATELDARRYAHSWGRFSNWDIFAEMNPCLEYTDEHIRQVGRSIELRDGIPKI